MRERYSPHTLPGSHCGVHDELSLGRDEVVDVRLETAEEERLQDDVELAKQLVLLLSGKEFLCRV